MYKMQKAGMAYRYIRGRKISISPERHQCITMRAC